ncbi:P-loop NTPase [Nitratiruptor sp. YY09-18]|uniref:P-loop NTPase n=1 Tax=Nitratiruptor sp. YY09-18 TaxID=2724901 RepID=UPI001914E775|nr:P-loop NTPase [Nitratiruptor sp. YY09-18]BCD67590.1 flagellar biosynthesis protein FlhG [Nitratiruptor sp. YY09-18]
MRFITITSGKGGVGKSTIAANIAYLLSIYGYKTAIFDADIGLANQDIILGVKPEFTILDVMKGKVSFERCVIQINNNLYLIPGESGEEILEFDNQELLDKFYKGIEKFADLDFLIIDTGAGIGESVQSFIRASTDTIIVTVPDPSAIMDAYSMIKYSAKIKDHLYMIINRAKNKKEALEIFQKIQSVAERHIPQKFNLELLGFVQKSDVVEECSKARQLVAKEQPSSIVAMELSDIVKKLTNSLTKDGEHIKETPNIAVFFKRLLQKI